MNNRITPSWASLRYLLLVALTTLGVLTILASGGGGGGSGTPPGTVPVFPRFAYVANFRDDTLSLYTVDATTGQLRHRGYVATGASPFWVTVDPSGQFVYVANQSSSDVSAFRINAATGALTAVAGSPFAAGTFAVSVTTTGTIQ